MFVMPLNRHMTWGDRQAEAAREKNLKKLQKLAAQAGAPTEQVSSAGDKPTSAASPRASETSAAKATTSTKAAKVAPKAPAKKTAPAKPAKKAKK